MDVAKRLSFDPTDTLNAQRFASANMEALQDLQKAVQDLSVSARHKHASLLGLAKQTAEQGIGDNDLKRLQRQFDSNKATFVNIDQKQRFMAGLLDLELDIEGLTAVKDEHEAVCEREAEGLRALKPKNEQARAALVSVAASISQTYSQVEQATAATTAQLDATAAALSQAASSRPGAADEAPLPPGPGLVEAGELVDAELAQAKELERSIATAEALLADLEAQAAADRHRLSVLRAEVDQLEALASSRSRAASAGSGVKDATRWCEELLAWMAAQGGLSVREVSPEQLVLSLALRVPTSRPPAGTVKQPGGAPPPDTRELEHELTLALHPGSAGDSCGPSLAGARLSPGDVDIADLVEASHGQPPPHQLAWLVREVRGRLLAYWQRAVLVEAAAEAAEFASSARGGAFIKARLPHGVEVEVGVPLSWPSGPEPLMLAAIAAPGLEPAAAAALAEAINADAALLASTDLRGLLCHVCEAALDAAAAE